MYYIKEITEEIKNEKKYISYLIGDTETGLLKKYSKSAFQKLSKQVDILGHYKVPKNSDEEFYTVDDEYISLLHYIKLNVLKLAISSKILVARDGNFGIENRFVDITELCLNFCRDNGIVKQDGAYYPKRSAYWVSNEYHIAYHESDTGFKQKLIYKTRGIQKELLDKTYYNMDDGCLYLCVFSSSLGNHLELIRMVDFKHYFEYRL